MLPCPVQSALPAEYSTAAHLVGTEENSDTVDVVFIRRDVEWISASAVEHVNPTRPNPRPLKSLRQQKTDPFRSPEIPECLRGSLSEEAVRLGPESGTIRSVNKSNRNRA